jgi:hypothetical protein
MFLSLSLIFIAPIFILIASEVESLPSIIRVGEYEKSLIT